MSIVQKVKGNHKTFGEVSTAIFPKILAEARGSRRIDVVFDVYRDISIKNIERMGNRSSSAAPVFKNIILSTHKIQQWSQFLKGINNKGSFIRFIAAEWKKDVYVDKFSGKEMYIAYEEECWMITENAEKSLFTNQEEADN